MYRIIDTMHTDFQAHRTAWLAVINGEDSLSSEEKALLENRINPIFREMQIALNTTLNGIILFIYQVFFI